MRIKILLLAATTLSMFGAASMFSAAAWAETSLEVPKGSEKLVQQIREKMPQLPIEAVFVSPIEGMFGVELAGGQVLYGSQDGRFLINGDMYQIGDTLVNLAEERRAVKRRAVMSRIPREEMVVFSPKGPTKDYVTVFTDVDCGYCRKLHMEMAELNALGIEVRYLAYPRQGLGTPTYKKIVSAWCSDDPNDAMTALKSGRSIPEKTCDNPVAKQFEIGQQVGVNGTPAIVTSTGQLLPGYMPAKNLAEAIGLIGSD